MKSLFADLDQLIESAVSAATKSEKNLQNLQVKNVSKAGVKKKKEKNTENDDDDIEEADEEEGDSAEEKAAPEKEPAKTGDESAKKITGTGDDAAAGKSNVVPGTRTSKKLADPPEKVLKNPQYTDVAQKINTLRGGSSLRSKPISTSVQDYVKSLTSAEKAALLTYLTNLSQIMAPVKKAGEVNDPSDVGIDVKFRGGKAKVSQKTSEKSEEPEKVKSPSVGGVVVVGED